MIIAIISIILMIIIHEFGHFIAGKLLKVPVYEFAIGMGPKILQKQGKKETKYTLRAIPIGGFCSFDKGDATGIADMELNSQPVWKRIIIFIAGSLFNLISALIVSIFICGLVGTPQPTTQIGAISLEETDDFFQVDDIIVAVNGINVEGNYELFSKELSTSGKTPLIAVKRGNELLEQKVNLVDYNGNYIIGVGIKNEFVKAEGVSCVSEGFKYTIKVANNILLSLKKLVTGQVSMNQMSGIVGIVSSVGDASKQNILNIFSSFIMLSVNLGIFNLLPIPVLDGSKILFCLYEAIFKKRISEKLETVLTVTFAILLILFMIIITFSDIIKILFK